VKDVFARPAAHVMAMGEARNGGEVEIGQVVAGGRIGVDLGEIVLRRRRDRVVAAEGEDPAPRPSRTSSPAVPLVAPCISMIAGS
jgi:hypothetical protein